MPRPLSTPFDPARLAGIRFVTWVGFWVNLVLCVVKVLAGILGNSRAVTADGVHSISDLVTDIISLVGVRFWPAPPDVDPPHGHRRLESLISLLVGLLLGLAGLMSVAGMSAVNFALGSDFRWLLILPVLAWALGLALAALGGGEAPVDTKGRA